jgi:hypothetical protein
MQNHAKKWFDNTNSTNAMAAIAIGAMLVFSAAGMKAFADTVNNDVVVGGTDTITAGGSTTINYKIIKSAAGSTPGTTDPNTGCNPADGTEAKVTIIKDDAVTATPGSLTFTACNDPESVVFKSSTPGDYVIDVDVSDSGTGTYKEDSARFTLHVNAADPPVVENTPPTITVPADISVPATSASGASVPFEVTATDTEDGDLTDAVQCSAQSGDTFHIGTTTVTCSVQDSDGAIAEDSFTITVTIQAVGFYQPVDNPSTVNSGKAGQAYPLKFEVFGDASDSSTEITETSVIESIKSQKTDCTSGTAQEDALETTASGSTQLRYDSTGGQFIYNWKTPTTKNTCYQVEMQLIEDMGSLTALFKMK